MFALVLHLTIPANSPPPPFLLNDSQDQAPLNFRLPKERAHSLSVVTPSLRRGLIAVLFAVQLRSCGGGVRMGARHAFRQHHAVDRRSGKVQSISMSAWASSFIKKNFLGC